MFKDNRYINAGENEIYRYGKKAIEKASAYLTPNKNGFYQIPVDGLKYWTIGTSKGKFGEFASIEGMLFSVNSYGMMYAKAGTEKGEKFVKAVNSMIAKMRETNAERIAALDEE